MKLLRMGLEKGARGKRDVGAKGEKLVPPCGLLHGRAGIEVEIFDLGKVEVGELVDFDPVE
jgi:hypothetical protein